MTGETLSDYFRVNKRMVDEVLEASLPPADAPPGMLHEAMRYAVFPGGKRLRPILVIAASEAAGGTVEAALPAAAAVELIHSYSLVHDDLPAMDDDDLRRGRPTCHKKFGVSTALLAGDALLTHAFGLLAELGGDRAAAAGREAAAAAGSPGMIAGQVFDLESDGPPAGTARLEEIYLLKTGKLMGLSLRVGALAAGAGERDVELLGSYGEDLGVAFQILDDLKDEASDRAGALSYPRLVGVEGARARARELLDGAKTALSQFGSRARVLLLVADSLAGGQ